MVSSLPPLVDEYDSFKALQVAKHKGWLAGVALRIGCGIPQPNPYEHESLEHLEWEVGFEEGYAG